MSWHDFQDGDRKFASLTLSVFSHFAIIINLTIRNKGLSNNKLRRWTMRKLIVRQSLSATPQHEDRNAGRCLGTQS